MCALLPSFFFSYFSSSCRLLLFTHSLPLPPLNTPTKSCYLKLENAESCLNNCNHALEIDNKNPKAFFRRSMAYEAKKDWTKALDDIKSAQTLMDTEDKAISLAAKRIKAEQLKEKEKEKSVWGKAFAK